MNLNANIWFAKFTKALRLTKKSLLSFSFFLNKSFNKLLDALYIYC